MANVVERLKVISDEVKTVEPDVCRKMQRDLKYVTKSHKTVPLIQNHTTEVLQNIRGKIETDLSGGCQVMSQNRFGEVEILSVTISNLQSKQNSEYSNI